MAKKVKATPPPVRDIKKEDEERTAQAKLSALQTAAAREIRLKKAARQNPEVAALIAERNALHAEVVALRAKLEATEASATK